MSKVLVIYAHPETAKGSSTHELYKHFINSYTAKNPGDEIIVHNISEYMPFRLNKIAISIYNKGLAKSKLDPDEEQFNASREYWINEFVNADKYIFVNPMYNLFIPAEMKRYIDAIMQAGKTFHYDADGLSIGDLHGKKAIHLQASGGNYHNDHSHPDKMISDLGDQYLHMILHLMGVDDYSTVFAEGMDKSPIHAIEILDHAYANADKAGKEF